MKKVSFVLMLLIFVTLIFSSCNSNDNSSNEKNDTNEIYMNQKGSWSNGVEFSIYNHRETSELDFGLYKYTTNDKFLVIGLRVYNGSSEVFSADGTDVWLLMGEAKIYQQNIAERHVQGYDDINQSPTVTKEYFLFFEIGNNVSIGDLKLVINNGGFFDSESLVIKLKNSPKDCTVTLNYACERENDTYSFYSGTTIYPSNFPTPYREGYEFLGWYFNADYSGDVLTDHILEEKQNLTLYAKWEKIIHINYHYQYENKTESVLLEEKTNYALVVPSRLGYTFGGWFSNSACTGDTIAELTNPQDDVNVFAKWTGNPVNIIFNGNGATAGAMENQAAAVGESKKLSENKYSKEGYIFLGWSLDSEGENAYENQADFIIIPTDEETITLYAKWMPRQDIPYTINHYLQNAYDNGYTLKHTFDKNGVADSTISPVPNSYEGFTSPNAKTVTVAANGSLIIDYYYTRNSYMVTFVTNGGSSSIDTLTQKYETTFDLPTIERTGYTFGGWFIDPELTTPLNILSVPSENISIYAWWQEENKPNDFTYLGTDSIAIKTYIGENTMVHIPSYIGGVCVREISSYAFYNKNSITKIIIPDSVTLIGSSALQGCSSLEEIVLPFIGSAKNGTNGRLGEIFGSTYNVNRGKTSSADTTDQGYYYRFEYTYNGYQLHEDRYVSYYIPKKLKKVTVTNQTEVPAYAFMNCDLLEEIVLPENITSIGEKAFYECQNISTLNIGNNVLTIGNLAFYKCIKLSCINNAEEGIFILPAKLTSIGNSAFYGCISVSNVMCGNVLSQIESGAFIGCTAINKFNSDVTGELIIPSSLREIKTRIFVDVNGITKITVHNNVVSIESGAFEGMAALEEIILPFVGASATETKGSTKVLGHIFGYQDSSYGSYKTSNGGATYQYFHSAPVGQSFYRSYKIPQSLRKVTITNQAEIPDNAFMNCDLLEEIVLPEDITSIGKQAFYMCSNIRVIDIGDSLMLIDELAFMGCGKLEEIHIPVSVITINQQAFRDCTSLTIKYDGDSIPSTWDTNWNYSNCIIVTGEPSE